MLAKVKPHVFLDSLSIEFMNEPSCQVTAVLKDEKGSICRSADYHITNAPGFTWTGLNDLPYGVYSLELSKGEEQVNVRVVKRV